MKVYTVVSMIDAKIKQTKGTINKLEGRINGSSDVISILQSIVQCGYTIKGLEELKEDLNLWKVTEVGLR